VFNWALKKILWNSLNYVFEYFDINLYKKIKVETVTHILLELYLEKKIVLLILAFI
jgi:hypothetical protein